MSLFPFYTFCTTTDIPIFLQEISNKSAQVLALDGKKPYTLKDHYSVSRTTANIQGLSAILREN